MEGRHAWALYLVKVEGVQVVLRQIRDGVLVSGAPYVKPLRPFCHQRSE